ncbi:MAG: alkaline phosphatase [Rivularia sp. (in: Bacteria)]|nr:alkaline phosphatase [Rivularia sp. MS3]
MAKNVIIMIGDGMGWEMARAAAIQQQINDGAEGNTLSDFYTEGTGTGLSFQELDGYAIATTSGTYIDGSKSNSALKGNTLTRETGVAVVREGFEPENLPGENADGEFDPAQVLGFFPEEREGSIAPILGEFDPGFDESPVFATNADGELVQVGGFLNAYDLDKGRDVPWEEDEDPDYPKNLFPDSANTASTLYSGVKTYSGAIGVDIYEDDIQTIGEVAREQGKSFGVVSSVPFNHATPGSAIGHVSQRNKLTATSRVENFEVVLDENGVPLHEEHGDGSHEGEPVFELDENGNPIPVKDDNILFQILEETQPEVVLAGGHPDGRGDERYMDSETLEKLRNGETVYTFTERGENAAQVLADTAAEIDVDAGEKLFGLYGARGQGGNLPWSTANRDYSNTGLSSRLDAVRPLKEEETGEDFIDSEVDANPTLAELTSAALDVLGDDEDGFWVSIEGGDIDWAAHDNNLDNMIGATLDFADSVEVVQDWIAENGGYEENLLIVTADHDHYLTLNENFPELLREMGAEALTTSVDENGNVLATEVDNNGVALEEPRKVDNLDPDASGHYWGSDPEVKVGWSHHTTIPVPVYYQGAGSEYLDNAIGEGFEQYGFDVPGVDGLIDQVHIAQAQFAGFAFDVPVTEAEENEGFKDNYLDWSGFNGDVEVTYTISREADFDNNVYFYSVDDMTGAIAGVEAGTDDYLEAVLGNIITPALSTTDDNQETGKLVNMEAGSIIGTMIIADGTLEDAQNDDASVYFSFGSSNDGFDHIRLKEGTNNVLEYEDLPSGGDADFDDLKIEFTGFKSM